MAERFPAGFEMLRDLRRAQQNAIAARAVMEESHHPDQPAFLIAIDMIESGAREAMELITKNQPKVAESLEGLG